MMIVCGVTDARNNVDAEGKLAKAMIKFIVVAMITDEDRRSQIVDIVAISHPPAYIQLAPKLIQEMHCV